MERRPTRTRTTLGGFLLALTLIAPWAIGQDPDPITEIRRQAEQGDADAQYSLGYRYATGIGVPQDRGEAGRWLRLAAAQGHIQADDFLGRLFPEARSVPRDDNDVETPPREVLPRAAGQGPQDARTEALIQLIPELVAELFLAARQGDAEALELMRQLAEQGDADAQFNLGVMYDNGLGVPENDAEAVRWYRLAAEQGNVEAQFILGRMYTNGDGVPQDTAEAARWHRLAAENGYVDAQTILGFRYSLGLGVLKDFEEAVRWFQLAAEQRDAEAQYNLGVMYENGEGVPQDDAEAARWYRLAAEQGHPEAQFNLGRMYFLGQGVLKDSVITHMWLNIAGANGHENARESRDSLERDMTRDEIIRATELARTCMASDYQDCGP